MSKTDSKPVEVKYQKLTHHEHVLTLPDTYIGSVSADQIPAWIYNEESKKMEYKNITYVPGLYKIYDEILVNAHDHSVRDPSCKSIKVNINQETGEISVWNDGNGILVEINEKEKIYNPELIFGNLLTSSNYKQSGKTWGGKNGYGAKLTNIYSKHFYVDTVDAVNKKRYRQHFYDNMYKKDKPEITSTNKDKPYTKITFIPDYQRFGLEGLTDDLVQMFQKRVFDIAACDCKRVKVYLNDELISISSFGDYIKLFFPETPESHITYCEVNDCWKLGIVYTPNSGFNHISYVNGLWTYSATGGTHVQHATEQIMKGLMEHIKSKYKNVNVKPAYLKENMTLFVDCITTDPDFNSQTKECLTTKISAFLKKCEVSNNFILSIIKTGIVEDAIETANLMNSKELKKTDGKKVKKLYDIDKLDDAKWAGTRRSKECRLIITEGDSAKSFAVNGLEIIGNEKYGVFPIRGKMLNVRDATPQKVLANAEIKKIKQIIGLKQNVVYNKDNIDKLRYGGIFLLTDADVDGYHIKGLVINFIECFWPGLLQIDGFFQTMNTPIIKVAKRSDKKCKHPIKFYTMMEFNQWKDKIGTEINKWSIDYYKGLGSSTDKESREEFIDFAFKKLSFVWEKGTGDTQKTDEKKDITEETKKNDEKAKESEEDSDKEAEESETSNVKEDSETPTTVVSVDPTSKSHQSIVLAFSKSLADQRKEWLKNYDKNITLKPVDQKIPFSEFVHKELIHFSNDNNLRSIPSMCDGLKPSQRKILFTILEMEINSRAKRMKVQDFGSKASERTKYIHGGVSLYEAITKMGQNFPCSNNINLLVPDGNFGHRRQGGADAANERYTHTYYGCLTRLIFRKEDDPLYNYLVEEGKFVEPETYAPIIPMVLVNGAQGIGTGYSTSIPCYNPKDIIENLLRMIGDKDPHVMKPWYKGFTGKITKKDDYSYLSEGIYEIPDEYTVKISEIPVDIWTDDYESFLKKIMIGSKENSKIQFIDDYDNSSGNNTINFTIQFSGHNLQRLIKSETMMSKLKLISPITTTNMYLYDDKGKMTKYDFVEDILREFYDFRLAMYEKRKIYYTKILKNDLRLLTYKIKFIRKVCDKEIIIAKKKKSEIIEKLVELKFPKLSTDINAIDSDDVHADDEQEEKTLDSNKKKFKSYSYLTNLSLFSLTEEEIEELEKQHASKKAELDIYENTSEKDIWKMELGTLLEAYEKWLEEELENSESGSGETKKKTKRVIKKKKSD